MSKVIYTETKEDYTTGEIVESRTIKRKVLNNEHFFQAYTQDIGVLLNCTKGQIDVLFCIMKLGFVEFNTNELILNAARRKELADCAGIKLGSTYNLINGLKNKSVIISDEYGKEYLNPKLFFFGNEVERQKMLSLNIHYVFHNK